MARLGINIVCLECKTSLNLPPDMKSEGDLIISVMQFNKFHNVCEDHARAQEEALKQISDQSHPNKQKKRGNKK